MTQEKLPHRKELCLQSAKSISQMTDALLTGLIFEQNRYFVAFLNNMLACYFLMVVTSLYKTAYLPECKHSQNAVLHGSE